MNIETKPISEMTLEEVDEALSKAYEHRDDEVAQIRMMESRRCDLIQEQSKKYIGRCFKRSDRDMFFCITAVPPMKIRLGGSIDFNEHQLPCLVIDFGEPIAERIYPDTLFKGALPEIISRSPQPAFTPELEEITMIDFALALDKAQKAIRSMVDQCRPAATGATEN